jgi:hypothetical protein
VARWRTSLRESLLAQTSWFGGYATGTVGGHSYRFAVTIQSYAFIVEITTTNKSSEHSSSAVFMLAHVGAPQLDWHRHSLQFFE